MPSIPHRDNGKAFDEGPQGTSPEELERKRPGERLSMTRDVLDEVYDVIYDRKNNPKEGSYVASLFNDPKGLDKVLEKIGEESTEVIIAAKNGKEKEIVYECADLFFHVMILLAAKDIPLQKIREEFERRKK